jgi:hypothetical protein
VTIEEILSYPIPEYWISLREEGEKMKWSNLIMIFMQFTIRSLPEKKGGVPPQAPR